MLGCYLLTCADTALVANGAVLEHGQIETVGVGQPLVARTHGLDLDAERVLGSATTAALGLAFVADIGLPGFMDKVEALKKTKMDPLLKIAAKDIQQSRSQLEGLSSNKGTHMEKGFFAKRKSQFANWWSRRQMKLGDRIQGVGSG